MKRRKRIRAAHLDLWGTMVTSHCREPVLNLQRTLKHRLLEEGGQDFLELDDAFLRFCLTTNIPEHDAFIWTAANRFGCNPPGPNVATEFASILRKEVGCRARFEDVNETLTGLQNRKIDLGVISNLWSFPAEQIFDDTTGLGAFFPKRNRIYSFEVGYRKPEPQIFEEAIRRMPGLDPDEMLMIGDNLEADVLGALAVGMRAALIDRQGLIPVESLPEGVIYLRSLTEILNILDVDQERIAA